MRCIFMSGRLLREVHPELMDGLIQATKDGDQDKFLHLLGSETLVIEEEEDDDNEGTETVDDYEGQVQLCSPLDIYNIFVFLLFVLVI